MKGLATLYNFFSLFWTPTQNCYLATKTYSTMCLTIVYAMPM